jgi:hypothetical protein
MCADQSLYEIAKVMTVSNAKEHQALIATQGAIPESLDPWDTGILLNGCPPNVMRTSEAEATTQKTEKALLTHLLLSL